MDLLCCPRLGHLHPYRQISRVKLKKHAVVFRHAGLRQPPSMPSSPPCITTDPHPHMVKPPCFYRPDAKPSWNAATALYTPEPATHNPLTYMVKIPSFYRLIYKGFPSFLSTKTYIAVRYTSAYCLTSQKHSFSAKHAVPIHHQRHRAPSRWGKCPYHRVLYARDSQARRRIPFQDALGPSRSIYGIACELCYVVCACVVPRASNI